MTATLTAPTAPTALAGDERQLLAAASRALRVAGWEPTQVCQERGIGWDGHGWRRTITWDGGVDGDGRRMLWLAEQSRCRGEVAHEVLVSSVQEAVDVVAALTGVGLELTSGYRAAQSAAAGEILQWRAAALVDDLTGLANRKAAWLAYDQRKPGAVLLLDLDGFKYVNDIYGHQAGDEVLREIAKRLGRAVGADGLVVRLAGDEFAVLVDRVGIVEQVELAARVRDRCREAIDTVPIAMSDGRLVEQCISAGATLVGVGDTLAGALRRADEEMYIDKFGGRPGAAGGRRRCRDARPAVA